MKTFLFIIILLFSSLFRINAQEAKNNFSCNLNNVSFDEFSNLIRKETGVKIFYNKDWTDTIKVTYQADSSSVLNALKIVLRSSKLEISEWHHNFVLLPGKQLNYNIPDYTHSALLIDSINIEPTEDFNNGNQYLLGRKPNLIKTITIGSINKQKNGLVNIFGKIIEFDTGNPIIGATVFIKELKIGTISDTNGKLHLTLKPGKYSAQFECLGYEKTSYQLNILSEDNFEIEMKNSVISLQEAVIYGDRQMNAISKDPGLEKISTKAIKEIPMMLGERDILKVSEMLPGIVSIGEGSAGLNVRGGNYDQNAFYFNNVPIYNTSHMFGFFPAFNSDMINDFTIYKGYIPAQYGGKLSSVFEITPKQGNKNQFLLRGGINPVTGNLTIEGPIIKDSLSFIISARKSYSDWILSRINDPVIRTSSSGFYDFSASVDYSVKKSNINLFYYQSHDDFKLSDINNYEYANIGASLNIRHYFNENLRNNFSLIGSQYSYSTIDMQEASSAYKHSYKIEHYELKNEINHIIGKNNLKYGLNFILYKLNRGTVKPYGIESLRTVIEHGNEQGLESAIYISDSYNVCTWLNISAGLRYSLYSYLGPKDVYTYNENLPKEIKYVNDTIHFGTNEFIKTYKSPELRAAIQIKTDLNGSLKLSFSQMNQDLFMLNNTITVAPNSQWKLSDYHLKPSTSDQYSLGIFRNFFNNKLESSVEVFYKKTDNFPEFKNGANFLSSPATETAVLQGEQKAYGCELFLKFDTKKIDGWIAYTYSKSKVKVNGKNDWDKINDGITYPSNYDIPHVINTLLNYHLSRRVTLSSVVTYQTGRPVTYPVSVYYIDQQAYIDYSSRNKYRIPDYFRLDLSLSIEGNLKKDKLIHSSWMFSLYNATGRKNAYSVVYKSVDGDLKSYKYSIIGTQFLTITWLFKLGNYATN